MIFTSTYVKKNVALKTWECYVINFSCIYIYISTLHSIWYDMCIVNELGCVPHVQFIRDTWSITRVMCIEVQFSEKGTSCIHNHNHKSRGSPSHPPGLRQASGRPLSLNKGSMPLNFKAHRRTFIVWRQYCKFQTGWWALLSIHIYLLITRNIIIFDETRFAYLIIMQQIFVTFCCWPTNYKYLNNCHLKNYIFI